MSPERGRGASRRAYGLSYRTKADDDGLKRTREGPERLGHDPLRFGRVEAAGAGADQREGERGELELVGERDGVPHAIADRGLRRSPEQVDPGDVDDVLEREPARARRHGLTERDRPVPGQLLER